ncbi:hypothetical protein A3L11_10210 [Thermococcus siculi]|uniref:Uncharacterized protein n=1 Tax=Thermococcus siculi TaxID=72803 RepID=A0A2Z2MMH5_9EURY|nr:hypothetical protein [Thermococcus siculi]ASJ09582.1 hypothetical protein A3L11_10210 [Thermococcus siculi]
MESRMAEVPFNAGWEALIGVAYMPEKLFPTFPYGVAVARSGEKLQVRLSFRRFFTKFEFEGRMEFAFNEPHATYILKGEKGLLVLSFAALDGKLIARASADIPGERGLGKKLKFLAENSALAIARMAESHHLVSLRAFGSPKDFIIRNFTSSLLPHTVRYVRFNVGTPTFRINGENRVERFTVEVEDNIVTRVEYESPSGSSITEVERSVLEVAEEDFGGVETRGEYAIRVT